MSQDFEVFIRKGNYYIIFATLPEPYAVFKLYIWQDDVVMRDDIVTNTKPQRSTKTWRFFVDRKVERNYKTLHEMQPKLHQEGFIVGYIKLFHQIFPAAEFGRILLSLIK